jgi:hypothetical protein
MRGRRPKPTRIKALTGNPGKRPLNAHEPRPEPALPDCPPELSPAAHREWTRLTGELRSRRLSQVLLHQALKTRGYLTGFRAQALQRLLKTKGRLRAVGPAPWRLPNLAASRSVKPAESWAHAGPAQSGAIR